MMTAFGWNDSGGGTTVPRLAAKELARRGWDVTVFHAATGPSESGRPYEVVESVEDGVRLLALHNRAHGLWDLGNPQRELDDPPITAAFAAALAWPRRRAMTVAFLGSAYPHKGPQLLVAAAQRTQAELRVEIHVPDAFAKQLTEADTRGVVELCGSFQASEIERVLGGVDVAALPSIWWDCAPLAAAECKAGRVPLIAPRLGGLAEAVVHEVDGLLFGVAQHVAEGALPRIVLLDEEEIVRLYRSCEVLVHPYRGEGFAIPVLEAMACGIPAIVTEGGPTDEFCPVEAGWPIRVWMAHKRSCISGCSRRASTSIEPRM